MNLRSTLVDGKIVDVLSEEEYSTKWDTYNNNPSISTNTAVEVTDPNGVKYVLPFRGKSDDRPGIYPDGSICFARFPDEEQDKTYRSECLDIVDFSDASTISSFLAHTSQLREMETNVLTDIDSVFVPTITIQDSPEMRAFKEAIILKHMDINKYAPRFGDNFLNDKRILRTNSITMNKLVSMCEKLDIEAELTLRNVRPDVANPMLKEVTVVLTESGGGDES